jgi:hypothetical protein
MWVDASAPASHHVRAPRPQTVAFQLGFVSRAPVALKSTTGDLLIMRALPWKTESRFRRSDSSALGEGLLPPRTVSWQIVRRDLRRLDQGASAHPGTAVHRSSFRSISVEPRLRATGGAGAPLPAPPCIYMPQDVVTGGWRKPVD